MDDGCGGVLHSLDQRPICELRRRRRPHSLQNSAEHRLPPMATTVDFNCNVSPGHQSSQDGSFIQDEDLHLICGQFGFPRQMSSPFDAYNNTPSGPVYGCGRRSLYAVDEAELPLDCWIKRQAENCDVNVAFLDFNSFTADRFADALRDRFYEGNDCDDAFLNRSFKFGAGGSSSSSSSLLCNNLSASQVKTDSMLPLGRSLCNISAEHSEKEVNQCQRSAGQQLISTDSLDWSSYNRNEEIIKTACATKTDDYVLTFDDGASSSLISSVASYPFSSPDYSSAAAHKTEPDVAGDRQPTALSAAPETVAKNTMISWNEIGGESVRRQGSLPRGKTFPGTCNAPPSAEGAGDAVGSEGHTSRFSLLKVFREKVTDTFNRFHSHARRRGSERAPPDAQAPKTSCHAGVESSGYHTGGTQSSQMGDVSHGKRDGQSSASNSPLESPLCAEQCHLPKVANGGNGNALAFESCASQATMTVHRRCVDVNHDRTADNGPPSAPWIARAMAESGAQLEHLLTSNGRTFVDLLRKNEHANIAKRPTCQVQTQDKCVQTCAAEPFASTFDLLRLRCAEGQLNGADGEGAPELNFLRLPFSPPPLLSTVTPFPLSMLDNLDGRRSAARASVGAVQPPTCASRRTASSLCYRPGAILPAKLLPSPPPPPPSAGGGKTNNRAKRLGLRQPTAKRDSGFESYAPVPSHFEDWESLAILLPQDVINACLSKSCSARRTGGARAGPGHETDTPPGAAIMKDRHSVTF